MLARLRCASPGVPAALRWFSAASEQMEKGGSSWWDDNAMDCHTLYKNLINKLDKEGPQTLLALFAKCNTVEDASRAVKATRRFRAQRGRRGIVHPLEPQVTVALVKAATRSGNPDAALDALTRVHELQLTPVVSAYRHLMIQYTERRDPMRILETYEAMKAAGVRPNAEVAFCLVRGFVDCGVPEAAKVAVKEFEANGVEPPAAALRLLGQGQPTTAP